jgi:hypothetical protein
MGNASQNGKSFPTGKHFQTGKGFSARKHFPTGKFFTEGYPSQKYFRFHAHFLGRVFAFKYDHSGKVYGFFVKYSPLHLSEQIKSTQQYQ